MIDPSIAHVGHSLESASYMAPFVGFALWLLVTTIRFRRREGRAAAEEAQAPQP